MDASINYDMLILHIDKSSSDDMLVRIDVSSGGDMLYCTYRHIRNFSSTRTYALIKTRKKI